MQEKGSDPIGVTIKDVDGNVVSTTSTAAVADAELTGTGTNINAVEGNAFTATVATFTDANPKSATIGDFTATITWGDGTTSTGGTITEKDGIFSVTGTHTYAEKGTDPISVTIKDVDGNVVSTTSTATVADAELTGTGTNINAVRGQCGHGDGGDVYRRQPERHGGRLLGDDHLGRWHDLDRDDHGRQRTGCFSVTGTHTYAEKGSGTRSASPSRTSTAMW